jgi:nitrogen fixation NifU-like protein
MHNYQEKILDHYHHPRKHGELANATHHAKGRNTSCGDTMKFDLIIKNNIITDIAFVGDGCAISQAAASILAEHTCGHSVDELKKINKDVMLKLLEIPLLPARIKCGLLALETAQNATKSPISNIKLN